MYIVKGFQIREILDEIVAVPTGEVAQKFSGIVGMNEVGKFLFEKLSTEQTVQSLVVALMEEYEVEEQTATEDVKEFLEELRKNGLLVE